MPASLHAQNLAKLHTSYQGIEMTRFRACSYLFGNDINRDIEEDVRDTIEQEVQSSQPHGPMIPYETPSRTRQAAVTDDMFAINRETHISCLITIRSFHLFM